MSGWMPAAARPHFPMEIISGVAANQNRPSIVATMAPADRTPIAGV